VKPIRIQVDHDAFFRAISDMPVMPFDTGSMLTQRSAAGQIDAPAGIPRVPARPGELASAPGKQSIPSGSARGEAPASARPEIFAWAANQIHRLVMGANKILEGPMSTPTTPTGPTTSFSI